MISVSVDPNIPRCAGCGLEIPGGTAGCQELFDAESMREFGDVRFARRRRLVVDTYALQHPDQYCVSAISLAAHLTGVCIGVEEAAHADTLNVMIQRWLSRRPILAKPALPTERGTLTIADVRNATQLVDQDLVVRRWALSTWNAYDDLHPLARTWIDRAAPASTPRSHDIARR